MSETLTTELEAVNVMLDCINESPVSDLTSSGLVDVAKAVACLAEVSRQVQEKGWHFNSEEDYPLNRQITGEITLAQNMLRVDTTDKFLSMGYNVAQRGTRLYWKDKHSYLFDKDLEGDVTFYLPWTELPQAARHYINIKAARIYQGRQLGSDTKHKFSEAQELESYVNMTAAEVNNGDYNMFNDSWSVANILDR